MTLKETKDYTKWLVKAVLIGIVMFSIVSGLLDDSLFMRDNSDQQTSFSNRSGLAIRTDYLTGCQFHESTGGQLIKRTDVDDNWIGCYK